MTRGTLFYYEDDNNVWSSTEFNGDMYHGTPEKPEGVGDDVIKLMSNLKSVDDFKKVLKEINKEYNYEEGNDCYSVGKEAIEKDIANMIKWIDEERPDLRGSDADPREWTRKPSFNDTTTWVFWCIPNLSDYSYIYNNSGKALFITTKSKTPGVEIFNMVIPDGAVGILNFRSNDSIFKDGKLVDGMGKYEESKDAEVNEPTTMNGDEFYDYIIENFTLDGTSRALVKNIIDYVSKTNNGENAYTLLNWLLDDIGLNDDELRRVQL